MRPVIFGELCFAFTSEALWLDTHSTGPWSFLADGINALASFFLIPAGYGESLVSSRLIGWRQINSGKSPRRVVSKEEKDESRWTLYLPMVVRSIYENVKLPTMLYLIVCAISNEQKRRLRH